MITRYKNPSDKRKLKVRSRVKGTTIRPRLTVHRTSKQIYAQVIDDQKQITLASASSLKMKKTKELTKLKMAEMVGESLAKSAKLKKVSKVVFDRGPFRYHGRVKALADSARKAGLQF